MLVLGDLNARVGSKNNLWDGVLGSYGVGKMNDNGLRLLTFCVQNSFVVTDTLLKLRKMHKTI